MPARALTINHNYYIHTVEDCNTESKWDGTSTSSTPVITPEGLYYYTYTNADIPGDSEKDYGEVLFSAVKPKPISQSEVDTFVHDFEQISFQDTEQSLNLILLPHSSAAQHSTTSRNSIPALYLRPSSDSTPSAASSLAVPATLPSTPSTVPVTPDLCSPPNTPPTVPLSPIVPCKPNPIHKCCESCGANVPYELHLHHQVTCQLMEFNYQLDPDVPTTGLSTRKMRYTDAEKDLHISSYTYKHLMQGSTYYSPAPSPPTYSELLENNENNLPFTKQTYLQFGPTFLSLQDNRPPSKYHKDLTDWTVINSSGPMFDRETYKFLGFNYKSHPILAEDGVGSAWAQHFLRADPFAVGGLGVSVSRGIFGKEAAAQVMLGTRLDQRGNVGIYAWNTKHAEFYNESIKFFDLANTINKRVMPGFHQQLFDLRMSSGIPCVGAGNIFNWAAVYNYTPPSHCDEGDATISMGVTLHHLPKDEATVRGGYFLYPQYKAAVLLEHCDVHWWPSSWLQHASSPIFTSHGAKSIILSGQTSHWLMRFGYSRRWK